MASITTHLEERLYVVLKRIAKEYQSAEQVVRNAERDFGLDGQEALEMAYDNIQQEARAAIKGIRRRRKG